MYIYIYVFVCLQTHVSVLSSLSNDGQQALNPRFHSEGAKKNQPGLHPAALNPQGILGIKQYDTVEKGGNKQIYYKGVRMREYIRYGLYKDYIPLFPPNPAS